MYSRRPLSIVTTASATTVIHVTMGICTTVRAFLLSEDGRYHMNKYHHYRRNHFSLHSIAATPLLYSGYNRHYSYCGPELLLKRWIHGYVALPLIRSFYCQILSRDFM